jgi:hypothetical protein
MKDGRPPILTLRDLIQELEDPTAKPQQPEGQHTDSTTVFDKTVSNMCPNLLLTLCIVVTAPLSTAQVERGFSHSVRVLTERRNRLTTPQLNNLMLVYYHAPDEELDACLDLSIAMSLPHW